MSPLGPCQQDMDRRHAYVDQVNMPVKLQVDPIRLAQAAIVLNNGDLSVTAGRRLRTVRGGCAA